MEAFQLAAARKNRGRESECEGSANGEEEAVQEADA